MHYTPPVQHHKAAVLRVVGTLPPGTRVTMTLRYEKALSRYRAHPFNHERGILVG